MSFYRGIEGREYFREAKFENYGAGTK